MNFEKNDYVDHIVATILFLPDYSSLTITQLL